MLLDCRIDFYIHSEKVIVLVYFTGEVEAFKSFVASIFYVGKGKRARPYAHFYEAISQLQKPKDKVKDYLSK